MNFVLIPILALVATFTLAYLDTKDYRFKSGTPFKKNILPSAIRVVIILAFIWLVSPYI